jgi:hypothetical protein
MAVPEIVFRIPDDRPNSGTISGIDSLHARSIYTTENQENQPFLPIFIIFIYIHVQWQCQRSYSGCWMIDLVPAQFPALIPFMPGQFTGPEIKKISHFYRFSSYLYKFMFNGSARDRIQDVG